MKFKIIRTPVRFLLIVLLSVVTFSSCRKELCYNHFRQAEINIEWEREWERDYGASVMAGWNDVVMGFSYDMLRPGIPEGVTMLSYNEGGTQPYMSFLSPDGDDVNLGGDERESVQSLLFYNNDTEYIVIQDVASLPFARASTTGRSRSSLGVIKELHPDERTINPPDVLYGAFIGSVPEIGIHQSRPLAVKMQPLVYTYIVRYEFEYGLQHVALARGALAGMAESVYLRDGSTSQQSATLLYDCEPASYGYIAIVHSFGTPGFPDEYYGQYSSDRRDASRRYTLNLELKFKNGKTREMTFDVSSQLASQPRGGVITVGGIRVEDDENKFESGFDVNVDDWGEHEDIDLPIGGQ